MNDENIKSILVKGGNLEGVLFQTAINSAKGGLPVWYISFLPFEKIPDDIIIPEKDVLSLITFIYLKDYQCLISHLNGIHLWRKTPRVILIDKFELYSKINGENYDPMLAALISTSILDSLSSISRKRKENIYLILTCDIKDAMEKRLNILRNLYFPKSFGHSEDIETIKMINEFII